MSRPTFEYTPPNIKTGQFNVPVYFYTQNSNNGPEPGVAPGEELFHCLALMYDPSVKDQAILDSHQSSQGLTIKIPDPSGEYVPSNKHVVKVQDYRNLMSDGDYQLWNVLEITPDYEDNRVIKIILGRDDV